MKKIKLLILNMIIILFLPLCVKSQNRYINWFFSTNVGIKFNDSGPSLQSGGQTNTEEGVATISDPCGNLLFYSDGVTIWNRKHAVMNNGSSLNGNTQSAEAVLIVPKPTSDSLYYVFTTSSYGGSNGFQYNIVDMSKQGGDGQVISKNNKLYGKSSEKLTAILHKNQSDYWILTHDWDSSKYKVFLLTDAGLKSSPVISVIGPTNCNASIENALGHLRPSPDGKKVASTFWYKGILDIYDFDNSNGRLTLDTSLKNFAHSRPYSIEFSPNNKILYVGEAATGSDNDIYQFDMTAKNIGNSRYKIITASGYRIGNFNLGTDGKFYVSRFNQKYLGVISNPNTYGSGVNFNENGFSLGSLTGKLGLPNQIYPFFYNSPEYNIFTKVDCSLNKPVKFELTSNFCYDSLIWDFDDTASKSSNFSRQRKATHTYTKKSNYNVTMTVYYKGKAYTIKKKIKVPTTPIINLGKDTSICGTINLTLIGADTATSFLWNDNSNKITLNVTKEGKYWVKSTLDACSAYDTIQISNKTIFPEFSLSDSVLCKKNNIFKFKNTSAYTDDKLNINLWKISDNSTYHDTIFSKSFTSADSFFVKLIVTSKLGCNDSITKKIIVNPNVNISFTINKTPQCFAGHDIVITNTSSVTNGTFSSLWRLGDGDSAVSKNISSKKYKIDSTFTVTLLTTTDNGCRDTLSKTVEINPNPISIFSINNSIQCSNYNSFNFSNTSYVKKGNIVKNCWNFGDGSSDTINNVKAKKYASIDSFNVQLLTISDKGCRDSISKKVYINPNSQIGFNINKTPQCFNGNNFVFTNTTTVLKGTYSNDWHLGDGTSSTTKDITSKTYSKDSSYIVRLITTTDKYCIDTIEKNIIIHPSPKAKFDINQINQCFKWNLYKFNNTSSIRTGSISNNYWKLGDTTTSFSKDIISKHYTTEDSFQVDLLTISNNGCRDSISHWIYILNTPKPDFTINKDTQCFNYNLFDFTNKSTITNGTFSNLWQMGDATSNTSKDIQKHYSNFGNYTVTLITTSDKNCVDTIEKKIRIHSSPTSKFLIDKDRQCFRGNIFNYTNQTTLPEGTLSYIWNLGESKISNTKDVLNLKYSTEDTFNVRLISTTEKNCKDTFVKLAVTFAQPIASFVVPQDSQCWQKHYFIIINNTAIKYGTMNHVWEFGDGTFDYTQTPSTKRYANKSADYILKYKVSSDHNCTDSAQKKISLLERPISDFSINDSIQCFNINNFSFANKTSFSAMSTLSYDWFYGDGSSSKGITPKSLSYPAANYYTVTLMSTSYLNNCADTIDKIIVVAPHSNPDFITDNDSQCLRINNFIFTNKSTVKFGTITYIWDFGDGNNSSLTNPSKKYNSGSNYQVKLIATTNYQCKDSIIKPVVLVPHPKAGFTMNDSTLCRSQLLDISNNTNLNFGNYTQIWHFDEGSDQTSFNVNGKLFNNWGKHPIRLAVISNFGCTDTIIKNAYLDKWGTSRINLIENDSQCYRGNSFSFSAFSLGNVINISSCLWNFGDGNNSTTLAPIHSYKADSTFIVKVITTSSNGCKDTVNISTVVLPHPNSDFESTSPCMPNPVEFTNYSNIKNGNIVSQLWDFGSGKTSTTLNPKIIISTAGKYPVKLISVSKFGCSDTVKKMVNVKLKPKALFTYSQIPSNDIVQLQMNNSSSSDVTDYYWEFGNNEFSNDENPIANYADSGRFIIKLEVTNSEGCKDTASIKTGLLLADFVLYIPSAFSPNENGINDFFKLGGSKYNEGFEIMIFNKWGEKVFESNNIKETWDGTYQGIPCPQGYYLCLINIDRLRGSKLSYKTNLLLLR